MVSAKTASFCSGHRFFAHSELFSHKLEKNPAFTKLHYFFIQSVKLPKLHKNLLKLGKFYQKSLIFLFGKKVVTGGQTDGPTDRQTDGPTDGWTYSLIEMRGRI